jgi:hypothetical protein
VRRIMDERRHFATIGDVARQIAESHRLYDSAVRSLTASTAMDAALKALAEHAVFEKASIASITSYLSELSKLDTLSSSIRAMTGANMSIKSIFESTRSLDSVMRSALEHQRRWQEVTKSLDLSGQLAEITLRRDTSAMLSASLAAQSKLLELQPYRLGAAIHATPSLQESLRLGLDKFSTNYNNLFDFIGHRPSIIVELEPVVTQYPSLEVFHEAELLEAITVPEDEQEAPDEYEVPVVPEERSLEDWLREIDTDLPSLLQGAREALKTANPDRARHVATSVRELLTHVLHRLAPDDGIRAWTTDPHYYDNGRPTKRARLLYINREINVDVLSGFVDADVNSALTLINALHGGTHGITARLTDRQLRALVDRMESLLLFLFRLNSTNE